MTEAESDGESTAFACAPPRGWLGAWLSLMLILLAVFVVLAAQAKPRPDRLAAAVSSVAAAFGHGRGTILDDGEARQRVAARVIEGLALDLATLGARAAVVPAPAAGLSVRVFVPIQQMFASELADDGAAAFLDRIAAAAAALPSGYRLAIVVTLPFVGADSAQGRAHALGGALLGRGLPAERLAIGFTETADEAIVIDLAAISER